MLRKMIRLVVVAREREEGGWLVSWIVAWCGRLVGKAGWLSRV